MVIVSSLGQNNFNVSLFNDKMRIIEVCYEVMKMTINDVARVAGVSKSTVSRYLNDGYVSDENREKIRSAIEETGYQTNVFARGLKTNRSKLIAIILPRLDSFTSIQSLNGMNTILSQYGYQMVVVPKNTIEEDEITYLRRITTQGIDGIIVLAHAITYDHVAIADSSKIPIIFVGQYHPQAHTITLEDFEVGKQVAEYVNTLDINHVLYLSVSESDQSVGVMRKQGFLQHLDKPVRTLITGFQQTDAYEIMKRESETIKYDIVVGATDNIAIGALRYLHDHGVEVPKSVKVVGIGNYDLSHYMQPTLTTLHIDYQTLGRNAANAMLSLLEKDFTYTLESVDLELIKRDSSQ